VMGRGNERAGRSETALVERKAAGGCTSEEEGTEDDSWTS